MDRKALFRKLPKVDVLMEEAEMQKEIQVHGREIVRQAIQKQLEKIRQYVKECKTEEEANQKLEGLYLGIREEISGFFKQNLRPVINGTGTILHTNLGRAPIGRAHMERVQEIATGYSNLEYHLEEGRRGERYSHFESLLCQITGAESAMAVNNNAAAVLLLLSSMAKGGEVIVSRGELVEIGGKFRIPDVMEQSGATLVEVGTTNKTHVQDYECGITEETKGLLKVHTSNYRIIGFTDSVEVEELVEIGRKNNLPVMEDLGSGVLVDLSKYGLSYEPTVQDSIKKGVDVVCFSGDKLLGGAQAGILVGKKQYIDQMKKNPLTRALRIDKFTAATLEVVLQEYLSEERAVQNIPVLRMMTKPKEEVREEGRAFLRRLKKKEVPADIRLIDCDAQIGGGSLPLERIPSVGIEISPRDISVSELMERLRKCEIPIIGRAVNDRVLLDLRTIETRWFSTLIRQLHQISLWEK